MLIKFKGFLCSRDYYKMAIIIICVNSIFEIAFQYRFQTDIEEIYFFISVVISVIAVRNVIKKDNEHYQPLFYCFWPIIIVCISFFSRCKTALMPFAAAAYIILIWGRFKTKQIKNAVMVLVTGLFISVFFIGFLFAGTAKTEVISTVYSPDNKYVMVLEESNVVPGGGSVEVYVGRNIDFGLLGRYVPVKRKYYGHSGERPELRFVDEHLISINGERIEIKGGKYIDDY